MRGPSTTPSSMARLEAEHRPAHVANRGEAAHQGVGCLGAGLQAVVGDVAERLHRSDPRHRGVPVIVDQAGHQRAAAALDDARVGAAIHGDRLRRNRLDPVAADQNMRRARQRRAPAVEDTDVLKQGDAAAAGRGRRRRLRNGRVADTGQKPDECERRAAPTSRAPWPAGRPLIDLAAPLHDGILLYGILLRCCIRRHWSPSTCRHRPGERIKRCMAVASRRSCDEAKIQRGRCTCSTGCPGPRCSSRTTSDPILAAAVPMADRQVLDARRHIEAGATAGRGCGPEHDRPDCFCFADQVVRAGAGPSSAAGGDVAAGQRPSGRAGGGHDDRPLHEPAGRSSRIAFEPGYDAGVALRAPPAADVVTAHGPTTFGGELDCGVGAAGQSPGAGPVSRRRDRHAHAEHRQGGRSRHNKRPGHRAAGVLPDCHAGPDQRCWTFNWPTAHSGESGRSHRRRGSNRYFRPGPAAAADLDVHGQ